MGKKGKWLSSLKKAFTPESKEKKTQKSKEQVLGKQVDLGSNDSDAATLETLNLSPPPQPQKVKLIEAEAEPSEQTYPVEVAIAAAAAVALAAPAEAVADVVRRQSNTGPRFAGKSNEEVAAIKIQTAFRVYLAKRALHALRGLVRLKSMMEGPMVKRQAAGALRCMQTISRVQCQIRLRRIRMTEENQALQRQLLQKHAKEIVNLQMGEDWDDSLQSKEQIEASLLSKHEASMRREKAMAYSFTHQQTWKNASRSMNPLFMDPNNPSWGWSWLERWMAAWPWEGRGMAEKEQNNDQSSVKSGRSSFGGDISKAYARYQLNLDKQSLKASPFCWVSNTWELTNTQLKKMAAKRLLSNSFSDQADEPKEKRTRPTPSFTSVIGEAVMDKCLGTALEPILRRLVHEEVERSLRARIRSFSRSPSLRIQAPQPSTLELIFPKALTVPVFTGGKIVDDESNQLRVILVDTRGNQTVPVLFPSPFKVDIVVLDGDFPSDGKNWSNEEFDRYIVKERTGKRPLLAGELVVTVRDGVGLIENLEFTDNSSWIRSRKFRIGAKVAGGSCQGVRIREAMTEAFVVKDHRGELYKKHHPPTLGDEVWRLEKIGKDGVFHKRLASEGVHTVQDFLKMWVVDHAKLRTILGHAMSEKMWNVIIKHAKTCVMGNKHYVFRGPDYKVLLNPICQLVNAEINGSIYTTHNLSDINRAYLENLVRKAYENWCSLEEIEGISDEIGLLTQGDHPSHQQPMVGSSQYKGYMTDRLMEGYIPNEMQANWEISPIYFNTSNENGARLNMFLSNSDDDLTSPKSFVTWG